MDSLPPVVAVLTANIKEFSAKMAEAKGEMDGVSEHSGGMGSKLATVGKGLVLGLGTAAVGVGAVAIKMGMDFQTGTAQVAANANISMKAAQGIGNAFLNTAGTTVFSGSQIQTAYAGVAAQLGETQGHALSSSQAMTVMSAAMDAAEASGNPLSDTVTQVANTMQAYGLKAKDAATVSNVLYETGLKTGLGIDGVSSAFKRLHTQLGITTPSIGQLGGLMVDLATHGETGRAAVSAVSSSMQTLLKTSSLVITSQQAAKQAFDQMSPAAKSLAEQYQAGTITSTAFTKAAGLLGTQQAANVKAYTSATNAISTSQQKLKDMGVTVDNAKGKFVGIGSVIAQLHTKIHGMTQAQALATIGTALGSSAATKMLKVIEAGPAAYTKATSAVSKQNAAHLAAEKMAKTLGHEFETLKATVEDYATKLGIWLIPKVQAVIAIFITAGKWLKQHKIILIALAGVIGGLMVAAITAYITKLAEAQVANVKQFATMIASIVKWVAATTVATVKVVASAVAQSAAWVASSVASVAAFVATAAAATAAWVAENAATLGIVAGVALLVGAIVYMATHWKQVWGAVKEVALAVWHFLDNDVLHPIVHFFTGLWHTTVQGAEQDWNLVWGVIKSTALAVWHFIDNDVFHPLVNFFTGLWHTVIVGARTDWNLLWNTAKTVALGVWNFLDNNIFHPIASFFNTIWHDAVTGAQTIWHTFWSGVQTVVQAVWNVIQPIINDIARGLGSVAHAVGDVTSFAGKVASHPFEPWKWAGGGLVTSPTMGVVGDSGPEIVLNPDQTKMAMSPAGAKIGGQPNVSPLPSFKHGGGGGGAVTVINVGSIQITGSSKNARQLANEIRVELLKQSRGTVNAYGQYAGSTI